MNRGIFSGSRASSSRIVPAFDYKVKTDTQTMAAPNYDSITGLNPTITLKKTNSFVRISGTICFGYQDTGAPVGFVLIRNGATPLLADIAGSRVPLTSTVTSVGSTNSLMAFTFDWIDNPQLPGTITYQIGVKIISGSASVFINSSVADSNASTTARAVSFVSAQEILRS